MPDHLAAILLGPAGLLYGAVMRGRNLLYELGVFKTWRSPFPVVSVGNVTTGGTGKTPLVDWIVRFYAHRGCTAAIVSRGYGRSTRGPMVVSDGRRILLGSLEAGDETAMLAARNPSAIVVVAEKRREGVELLMREFADRLPEVIVLDDAFQHRRIARDLDIVVINAAEPFIRAKMLPAGRLREPLAGLGRADLFILNKITDEPAADKIEERLDPFGKPVVRARVRPGKPVATGTSLAAAHEGGSLHVLAFAGIGAPEGFLDSLGEAGMTVVASRFFRDHEPYRRETVLAIVNESKRLGLTPVTTEKDWFRIRDDRELARLLENAGCAYLPIEPDIYAGRALLEKMLLKILT
ncbi:MAG: tetraacyldisaccharide 4'-kinase [Chlorobiaceae bacterium]|nr:tetraacyldisaccharide 4'-kinase [Chlorobiaceae bacterium]NTW74401.1 tetraacyldisaccharide 4'-kinase [Chlorobiaceae bacterium]